MASESAIAISGPWTHRTVSANGTRFHVASIGDGPLVVLLHGFPEFWWAWRRQLTARRPQQRSAEVLGDRRHAPTVSPPGSFWGGGGGQGNAASF